MKRKLVTAIAVLAAVALISGMSILIAGATTGAQGQDPLVTLSYLTSRFTPHILGELRNDISASEHALSQRFDRELAALEARLGQAGDTQAIPPADSFRVVTLSRGQRINASVGTEIMLRIGSATGHGSAPALVDYTNGVTLAAGSSLVINHMYLVTIEGNGVQATADFVRLLVRGEFTVS